MNRSRHSFWRRGPRALRRPRVRLENIALVPAHLLPRKAEYQAIANQLPDGDILLVLPPPHSRERSTMERVAQLFRAKGRHVTVLHRAALASGRQPMTGPGLQNDPPVPAAAPATLTSEMTEQLAGFQAYVRFASTDAEANRQRYYDLLWQPTLFGEGALVRVWGRQGQSSTRRVTVYPDRDQASAEIRQVVRRRLRHGYQVVDWQ